MGYTIQVKYIEFNDDTVLLHYRGGKLLLNNKNVHEIKRTKKPLPMLYLRHQPKEKRKEYSYLLLLDDNGVESLLNWWNGAKKKPHNLLQIDGGETI